KSVLLVEEALLHEKPGVVDRDNLAQLLAVPGVDGHSFRHSLACVHGDRLLGRPCCHRPRAGTSPNQIRRWSLTAGVELAVAAPAVRHRVVSRNRGPWCRRRSSRTPGWFIAEGLC